MGLRRWLVALLIIAPATAPLAVTADTADRPIVTAAVQVTADPSFVRSHTSPQVARSPRTGVLVVVEANPRGSRACEAHYSVDDGRSWFAGGNLMSGTFVDCTTESAEYGPYANLRFAQDGTLYVAFVASEKLAATVHNSLPRSVFLARSTDDGRSFATATVFRAPEGTPDRGLNKGPMLAVDPNDASRVYVGWRQGIFSAAPKEKLKSNIATSSDGGKSFGQPVDLTDDNGGDYPAISVSGDGTVHAAYWRRTFPPPPSGTPQPVRPIYYLRSTDHGASWKRTQIDPGNQAAARPPQLAADPRSKAVYMVWYSTADANNTGKAFKGTVDIFARVSRDGGDNWTDRIVLNDDGQTTGRQVNHYDPGVSIAPNGRVDIAWYDGRNSPSLPILGNINPEDKGTQDVYYTSSTDQGRTFTANLRISDRSINRAIGIWGNNIESHYNLGVTSTEDSVYVAWQDTRNGNVDTDAEDIYAAALKLPGAQLTAAAPSSQAPAWALTLVGVAIGMGVTMVLVAAISRRRRRPPPTPDAI